MRRTVVGILLSLGLACGGSSGLHTVGNDPPVEAPAVSSTPRTHVQVTVLLTGTGSGRVDSATAGIACPGACTALVAGGAPISFTASADAGSTFERFGAACSGNAACTLSPTGDVTVWASFALNTAPSPPPPPPPPRKIAVKVSGSGHVTSAPAGIACPGTCSASFAPEVAVVLRAGPAKEASFAGWNGACAGAGECGIAPGAFDVAIVATFAPR
jgi:hypothetical protein